MSACNGRTEEPANPSEQSITDDGSPGVLVYETDSTEWRVKIFKEHILYSEVASITLPAPWVLPTREDAAVMRLLEYPHEERFVTSDGYTFGMPSASVSKAGQKTKYSVLGLHKRRTTIVIEW
jgi:hypothetical protein